KLRFLSPGEVSMVTSAGMGAGIKGFASLRGNLEMTGEDFVLVVSNGGTRQQVSFIMDGKGTKGMRKYVGQLLFVTGVVEKASGWGGKIIVENFEPRPPEARVSRDDMEIVHVEGEVPTSVDVKLNNGLTVRLQEQPSFTWAIEPTAAKRVGLREARFEPGEGNAGTREFFFTPRNPGASEVEFFLAKAFTPGVVERSFKITVNVKP
ncbi:MAG TPA: protease inhibitor I42 family protein, partial [Hyalangium sp.]|nr:protease inhibitor I42 family protein [Hyalangium sp.]